MILGMLLLTLSGLALLNKSKPVVENTPDAVTTTPLGNDEATPRHGDNLITQTESNSEVPAIISKDGKLIEVILNTDTPNNLPIDDILIWHGGIQATSQNNDPYVQPRSGAGNETSGLAFTDAVTTTKEIYPEMDIISPMGNVDRTEIEMLVNGYMKNNDPNSLTRLSIATGLQPQQLIDMMRSNEVQL